MLAFLRWLGFAMVAGGIAVFPFAIWFPGPWGVIALALVALGCLVLVAAIRAAAEPSDPDADEAAHDR
jgi:hypothetical protein